MMAKLPRALSPVREVAGPVPRAERDRIARNAAVQRAVRCCRHRGCERWQQPHPLLLRG